MRTWQRGNMPILLKTQVDRTAKEPIPACHASVGSLCDFQDTVERVPTGSPKTGRCAAVRERCRKHRNRTRWPREKPLAANAGTRRNGQNREILDAAARKRRENRTKPRGRARPAAVTSARGAGSFGDLRGRSKHSEKQLEGVAE